MSMAFPSSVTGFARATFPIPFVPSGHFPLTRGIGLAMTGFLTALAPPVGELARRQP